MSQQHLSLAGDESKVAQSSDLEHGTCRQRFHPTTSCVGRVGVDDVSFEWLVGSRMRLARFSKVKAKRSRGAARRASPSSGCRLRKTPHD